MVRDSKQRRRLDHGIESIALRSGAGELFILSADGSRLRISQQILNNLPGLRQVLARSVQTANPEEFEGTLRGKLIKQKQWQTC